MEFVIIGIVSALNLLIIKAKFERKRYEDAVFDLVLMGTLLSIFSGSYGGMVVSMIGSLIVSISFLFSPPKFFSGFSGISEAVKKEIEEIKRVNRK